MAVLVVEPEQEQEELPMVVVELALRIFLSPFRWLGYLWWGWGWILRYGWPFCISSSDLVGFGLMRSWS